MNNNKEIGIRIRQIRRLCEMNQSSLAIVLGGLATSTISAYENGSLLPQDEALIRLAELVSVTVDDVMNGGINFDEKVGNKASEIEARRSRVRESKSLIYNPTAGDIRVLIDRLDRLKEYLGETTEKLMNREETLSQQVSSEDEKKLLIAFRALPSSRKRRMLEDAEEWAAALEKAEH